LRHAWLPLALVLALPSIAGCLDYDFSEVPPPPDPRDEEPIAPRTCELANVSARVVEDPVRCVSFELPPLAHPTVTWRYRAGGRSLVAGPVLDTNGDGIVDEHDLPVIAALEPGTGPGHAIILSHRGELIARSPEPVTQPVLADLIEPAGAEIWFGSPSGAVWRFDPSGFVEHGRSSATSFLSVVALDGTTRGELVSSTGTRYEPATGAERVFGGDAHPFAPPQVQVVEGVPRLVTSHGVYTSAGARVCGTALPNTVVVVADLDDDGRDDVLALGPAGTQARPLGLVEQRACHTSRVLHTWREQEVTTYPLGVALADFTGDGTSGIAVSVWQDQGDTYGTAMHFLQGPNRWTTWHSSALNRRYLRSPIGVDLDGDGAAEVIASGPTILDGRTGEVRATLPVDGALAHSENPVIVVDLERDGHTEIVVASSTQIVAFTGEGHGWAPAPSIWNQADFNGANVDPAGRVPQVYATAAAAGNRYRAVPAAQRSRGAGSDLVVEIVDVCEYECESGWVHATVQVGNIGIRSIDGPVGMELYGYRGSQATLLAYEFYRNVPAARWLPSHTYAFEVDQPFDDMWAFVYPEGWTLDQCSERNDAMPWPAQVCW